jgi:hypothetical protein
LFRINVKQPQHPWRDDEKIEFNSGCHVYSGHVLVTFGLGCGRMESPSNRQTGAPAYRYSDILIDIIDIDHSPIKGRPDAPVSIVVFSDFQ